MQGIINQRGRNTQSHCEHHPQLVAVGLAAGCEIPYNIVVVLGHPPYYPRFGSVVATPYGIVWEHDAPDEAFMLKER